MNVAFIILCIIVVLVLCFFAYQGLRNVEQVNNSKNTYVLDLNEFGCYPEGGIENLPDISGNQCCVKNGEVTNLRLYGIPGYDLIVLAGDYAVPYEEACYGFCINVNPSTGQCDDKSNTQYGECIQAIQPVTGTVISGEKSYGCTQPALPIARIDNAPYYVVLSSISRNGLQELLFCDSIQKC
jgi:hypothetical protein